MTSTATVEQCRVPDGPGIHDLFLRLIRAANLLRCAGHHDAADAVTESVLLHRKQADYAADSGGYLNAFHDPEAKRLRERAGELTK